MNVLLITIDAWRASHASFMPDVETPYTPHIESLADEGVVFTQAISHGPATPFAFPSIFSSTLPLDYGGYERIDPERTLISERLRDYGWHCVGVHGNPWLGAKYGYGRGYESYHDVGEFSLPLLDRARSALINSFGLDHPIYRIVQSMYRHAQAPLRVLSGGSEEVSIAADALDTKLEEQFVWMHLLAPHAPYTPPERLREEMGVPDFDGSATGLVTRAQREPSSLSETEREAVRGLYAASVRHADEQVGELLRHVDGRTLVIVTADHGEALFDHGQVGHDPCLYDELLRVPLLVRPPIDNVVADQYVDQQVGHIDIAPTILDYAGIEPPSSFVGGTIRPIVEGGPHEEQLVVSEVASNAAAFGRVDPDALQVCVRRPDRKVVLTTDGIVVGYDLDTDPGETDPVADLDGPDWQPLRSALDDRRTELDVESTTEAGASRDADMQDRLRDLGYLD